MPYLAISFKDVFSDISILETVSFLFLFGEFVFFGPPVVCRPGLVTCIVRRLQVVVEEGEGSVSSPDPLSPTLMTPQRSVF